MPFALRNTYAHFKRNPWCGGLTGELRVERPYRNFLTSVQYMEWKVGGRWCRGGEAGAGRQRWQVLAHPAAAWGDRAAAKQRRTSTRHALLHPAGVPLAEQAY